MSRKLKIVLSVCLLLLAALVGCTPHKHELPAELRESRVLLGSNWVDKKVFYRGNGMGEVSQILMGWPADREGADLMVAGNKGVQFLDLGGHMIKAINFSERFFSPVQVVQLDESGNFGFLTRDESWSGPVLLFDKQGQEIWSYGSRFFSGADDSVAGDIDGDGRPEFAVAHTPKIHLINRDGREIWTSHDLNIWHLELLPASAGEPGKILHSNAGGELVIQDSQGREMGKYLPGRYVGQFAITRWGTEKRATHILAPNEIASKTDPRRREFFVLDSYGEIVTHFESPRGALLSHLAGTPVSFSDNNSYYALLQSYRPAHRSMLSLFDERSHLAYQEILGENCVAVASAPGKSHEALLVGCEDKIFSYSSSQDTKDSSRRTH
jgi:hypothetical protein